MNRHSSQIKTASRGVIVLIFALLIGLLMLLPACTGNTNTENNADVQRTLRIITSTPENTRTPTVTPTPIVPVLDEEVLSGTHIELWYVWTPAVEDSLAELVDWFNAENAYGILVTARAFSLPDTFEAAMQEALTSGQGPQLALAFPYQYQAWMQSGNVVDLTPYLENTAYGISTSELEGIYSVYLEQDLYGEERYGFPGLFSADVILYNQSWGEELGYANPPASAAQFQTQACAAAEESGGLEGGYMGSSASGSMAAWLLSNSGTLVEEGRYLFDMDPVEQAFAFLADLREAGCAWTPVSFFPDQDFFDRMGLFYSVTTHELPYIEENYRASGSSDEWIAMGYPNESGEPVITVSGRSYVVMQTSTEEQIAAWLLARELTSERGQAYLAVNQAYLPLDTNAAQRIQAEGGLPEQWFEAVSMLDRAASEPRLASWGIIRSVMQDAVGGVLSEQFEPGQLSLFLKDLNDMVIELSAPEE